MPRVHHVKKARKAIERAGIEVGDSYYWWKFRHSGKICSKVPPKPSQLTQSHYIGTALGIMEDIETFGTEDLERAIEMAELIRELGEETQGNLENMPEGLQQGDTGQLLEERVNACEEWADELENIEIPKREDYEEGDDGDEEYNDALDSALDDLQGICPDIS